jgi:lipoate-protein ligase B
MNTIDIGQLAYRLAWEEQERVHASVVAGGEEAILLVEHPPVITMGRRGETLGVTNLRASDEALAARDVEFVQTDRGGDITFHGPGQLVVYPIVRLIDHKLSVGGYVRMLQEAVIEALTTFGITGETDDAGIGVWVDRRKICAFGVRVKRGVTLHGLALNVTTDLSYFDLIVPCGIADRSVTSLRQILGEGCPAMGDVKSAVVQALRKRLDRG